MATNKNFVVKNGVEVGGNITVTGNITQAGLSFPNSDGTSGQYLQTDGSGNLTWNSVVSSFNVSNGTTTDQVNTGETLTFTGGTNITVSVTDNGITFDNDIADSDDITEGLSNLFFTETRAVDAIEGHAHLTIDGGTLYVDTDNNYVGIGDTSPQHKLDVAGGIGINGTEVIDSGAEVITARLKDSGVTAGSYGSASLVPVITVDAKGRITSASTTSVAGVSSFSFNGTSEVLTINTADGGTYTADISALASESYVATAISNLVDSAPGTLDTLNELAAALGDDPNFATTIATAINGKVDKTGGTITGSLDVNSFQRILANNALFFMNTNNSASSYIKNTLGAGASDLRLGVMGDDKVTILSNGNVGIGTSSPDKDLTVSGEAKITGGLPRLFLDNTGDGIGEVEAIGLTATDLRFGYAQNNIVFRAGSAERMRINSSGNVGIGVVPEAWGTTFKILDIGSGGASVGSSGGSDARILANAYFDTGGSWRYSSSNYASYYRQISGTHQWGYAASGTSDATISWSEAMRIDSSGNVGIGLSSNIDRKLHVQNDNDYAAKFGGTAAGDYAIEIGQIGNSGSAGFNATGTNGAMKFLISGSEKMRIAAPSGYLGVGTNNPYSALQVGDPEDTTGQILTIASRYHAPTGGPLLNFRSGHPSNSNVWDMGRILVTDDGNYNGRIHFQTSDNGMAAPTTKMTIKSSGNVGIGTSSPASKLSISGTNKTFSPADAGSNMAEIRYESGEAAGNYGGGLVFKQRWYSLSTEEVTTGGIFGIKTAGSGNFGGGLSLFVQPENGNDMFEKVRIDKDQLTFFPPESTTASGSIITTTSGTTYNTTSDRRLKDNIVTIANGKEKLLAMNPVTHTWKVDPNGDAVHGFIAQEMQEVVPEAVSGEPDGDDMMSMDYGRITPVIVAALQDALKEIEELKTRINELEAK